MKSRLLAFALLTVCFSCPVLAAATNEHLGAVPVLLGLDSVRKELGLSQNQCLKLDKIRADFKADVRLITTAAPVSATEKKAANSTVKDLLAQYNDKAVAVLTPSQNERLVQIEHQTLGGSVLFLPGLQKQLGLSQGQIAAIDKIHAEGEAFSSRVTASFENGDITLPERLETLKSYRLKQSAKVLRILTPEQRKTFETMQGNPFKPA